MSSKLRNFDRRLSRLNTQVEQRQTRVKVLEVPKNYGEFCSKIVMRSGGKMRRFELYKCQVLLSRLIDIYKNVTVVKSRQLGTTQAIIAKFLHQGAQNPAYAASCFMRNDDDAKAINARIRLLATEAKLPLESEQDKLIRLLNGAEIRTHNSSKEGNRSADSLCALLFDEAAFQAYIASIYSASVASTILTGDDAQIIVVSTPSAKSGWFWDRLNSDNGDRDIETICRQVANCELFTDDLPGFYWFEDELGGCKVFIHWRCHPVYSLQDDFVERQAKKLNMDMVDAEREFNLVFSDPAIEVFSAESVSDAENSELQPKPGSRAVSVGLYISKTHTSAVCLLDNVVIKSVSERNPSANTAINAVKSITQGYTIASIVLKSADGGEEIARRLRNLYKSARISDIPNSDFANTIASLSLLLEERRLSIPPYKNQLRDPPIAKHLRDFRRQDNKLGSLEPDKRDDCAWALAFSVRASENNIKRLPIGSS